MCFSVKPTIKVYSVFFVLGPLRLAHYTWQVIVSLLFWNKIKKAKLKLLGVSWKMLKSHSRIRGRDKSVTGRKKESTILHHEVNQWQINYFLQRATRIEFCEWQGLLDPTQLCKIDRNPTKVSSNKTWSTWIWRVIGVSRNPSRVLAAPVPTMKIFQQSSPFF